MERLIPGFMTYLMQVKNASKSTMSSYERDLKRLAAFLDAKGVHTPEDVTATSLNSYILFLEREGFAVIEAGDGQEAVEIFYENKDIALIILDVMMLFLMVEILEPI